MKPETLDKFHRAIDNLDMMELRLNRLAQALETAGNEKLAMSLDYTAGEAAMCRELISQALGETIGDIIKDTDASNKSMMEAILVTIVSRKR